MLREPPVWMTEPVLTAHLLPEAQGESGSRFTALIFVVTLAAMLLLLWP